MLSLYFRRTPKGIDKGLAMDGEHSRTISTGYNGMSWESQSGRAITVWGFADLMQTQSQSLLSLITTFPSHAATCGDRAIPHGYINEMARNARIISAQGNSKLVAVWGRPNLPFAANQDQLESLIERSRSRLLSSKRYPLAICSCL